MALISPPKAIIFDWDNTLVDTWPVIHAALEATFIDMGHVPWTLEQTKQRVAKSMRDSFPELFGKDWQKAGDIYQAHYKAIHLVKLEALPHAQSLLESIHRRGLFCVVVSNKKGPTLRKEVEHMGWARYFNTIIGADDAPRDKPYADPVQLAFKDSGLEPGAHTWFIGDSEIDMACAKNTGCFAILYGPEVAQHPQFSPTHFRGSPYHLYVPDHMHTIDLLAGDSDFHDISQ